MSDTKPSISPFRPWSSTERTHSVITSAYDYSVPSEYRPVFASGYVQEEPLSLVVKKRDADCEEYKNVKIENSVFAVQDEESNGIQDLQVERPCPQDVVRIFDATLRDSGYEKQCKNTSKPKSSTSQDMNDR